MKTINFLTVAFAAFIISISFSASSFSRDMNMDCKCCTTECAEAGCCKDNAGSSQGNSNCCTDKCTNEKCKDCCAGGSCSSMTGSVSDNTFDSPKGLSVNEAKSCCTGNIGSANGNMDCCK